MPLKVLFTKNAQPKVENELVEKSPVSKNHINVEKIDNEKLIWTVTSGKGEIWPYD